MSFRPWQRSGLTLRELCRLNVYTGECNRGIAHTPEWELKMAALQFRFDTAVFDKASGKRKRKCQGT